jgi:hypothetical protein
MKQMHEANALSTNQFKTTTEYMGKVMDTVPLTELYKVEASCNYHEQNEFCPVLVKIMDETILGFNKNLPFLLQVWSNKGEMVFEKALKTPIINWNIVKDKFLFQEQTHSEIIYLVKLSTIRQATVF